MDKIIDAFFASPLKVLVLIGAHSDLHRATEYNGDRQHLFQALQQCLRPKGDKKKPHITIVKCNYANVF